MTKHYRRIYILCALFALFLAAGCENNTPICADDNLQKPELVSPQDYAIVNSLTPLLIWKYPDSTCHPETYRVGLITVGGAPQSWSGETSGVSPTWSPASPLLPGRMYDWTVQPLNSDGYGEVSDYRIFFTGPMCGMEDLQAPELAYPPNGFEVELNPPSYIWEYPDPCLPESYLIETATDMDFNNIVISEETGNPSILWDTQLDMTDCTYYFWRVAALSGNSQGPYSETYYIHTNYEDNCPADFSATVRGTLWYDQCPVAMDADPVPSPLPEGCVVDSYGVDADGIHQPDEPNMLNVVVQIASGECPQEGTQSTITDIHGYYQFSGLTPGIYCLHVDGEQFLENSETAHWTLVAGDDPLNTYRTIFLGIDQTLGGQDFAWYQGAFEPQAPFRTFTPSYNVNCREGDDLTFGVLDIAMMATAYPIDGRNQDGDWVRIMLDDVRGCWVPADSGTLSGNIGDMRVLYSLPTPTPGIVNCVSYTDRASCEAQPACQWWRPSSTAPYSCVSK